MGSYHLPLNALKAFNAAADKSSFKLAADLLGVTPTAISHQVKHLESWLNVPLFHRYTRRIELTNEGKALHKITSNVFHELSSEIERLRKNNQQTVVTIALSPLVASHWLTPKLSEFWNQFPDIDLRIHHSHLMNDFASYDSDLAIFWGNPPFKGFVYDKIIDSKITPVCSLQIHKRIGDNPKPETLLNETLIHQRNHDEWINWFKAAGLDTKHAKTGRVIEDAMVALNSAKMGHGIALAITEFLHEDLSSNKLSNPFTKPIKTNKDYYLIYRDNSPLNQAVKNTHRWLLSQAKID